MSMAPLTVVAVLAYAPGSISPPSENIKIILNELSCENVQFWSSQPTAVYYNYQNLKGSFAYIFWVVHLVSQYALELTTTTIQQIEIFFSQKNLLKA